LFEVFKAVQDQVNKLGLLQQFQGFAVHGRLDRFRQGAGAKRVGPREQLNKLEVLILA
jgi:hypothetical protein